MRALVVIVTVVAACKSEPRPAAPPAPAVRWLKGQTHVHTDNSGDSTTPAPAAAHWYAQHGFDFLVWTDHNAITTYRSDELLTIPGVELTQNRADCDPPPATPMGCLLHVNALFIDADEDRGVRFPALASLARVDLFQSALDLTRELGGVAQLNHPNMAWAIDAALATELVKRGARFMEIANQNEAISSAGDADHPSTEAMWDAVLSAGVMVYGVASDDTHHYDDAAAVRARGGEAFTGDLGWVMVRAERDPAAIRTAMLAGDFYSSTGVRLADVRVDGGRLVVAIADDGSPPYTTAFIGQGGAVLATARDRTASFALRDAPRGYLRATVTDGAGRKAWTQPIRVGE